VKHCSNTLKEMVVVAGATVLFLLPFIGKAFHIDDPMYIWPAQQILLHPLDPFGFPVNWYGIWANMSDVTHNPPLDSYFIALIGLFAGWSEVALHLAFLFPAVAVTLGTYILARRLCRQPLAAALAVVAAPVFLVSSTNVMCDTLMLAFWVWAVHYWREGLQKEDPWRIVLSAFLIALSALTKYFGISLIPLLAVYALALRKRPGLWVPPLFLPVVILIGYQWWTQVLYGRGLLLFAVSYANDRSIGKGIFAQDRLLAGLTFLGGGMLPTLLLGPVTWPKRIWAAGFAAVILAVVLGGWSLDVGAQVGAFAAGGIAMLGLAIADLWERRDADSLLLVLWATGTFLFTVVFNWTVSGRAVLPLVPAVAILLIRRLDVLNGEKEYRRWKVAVPLMLSAGAALWVCWGDTRLANAQREAAAWVRETIRARNSYGTVWYKGHWGFQYYMNAIGAHPVDYERSVLQLGDWMVIPSHNTNAFDLPWVILKPVESVTMETGPFIATMHDDRLAGLYSFHLLPYRIGPSPSEQFRILRIIGFSQEDQAGLHGPDGRP
jgi:hypothetical protein